VSQRSEVKRKMKLRDYVCVCVCACVQMVVKFSFFIARDLYRIWNTFYEIFCQLLELLQQH